MNVSVQVKNVGARAGDEVVQLYVRGLGTKVPAVNKELRGFERVPLQPGEQRRVAFRLTPSTDLARYDAGRRTRRGRARRLRAPGRRFQPRHPPDVANERASMTRRAS